MAYKLNVFTGNLDLVGSSSSGGNPFSEIDFGNTAVDGTWRIIPSGNNLSFQRREGGTFVEKMASTP